MTSNLTDRVAWIKKDFHRPGPIETPMYNRSVVGDLLAYIDELEKINEGNEPCTDPYCELCDT